MAGLRFGWFIPTAGDTDRLTDPTLIPPTAAANPLDAAASNPLDTPANPLNR